MNSKFKLNQEVYFPQAMTYTEVYTPDIYVVVIDSITFENDREVKYNDKFYQSSLYATREQAKDFLKDCLQKQLQEDIKKIDALDKKVEEKR